MVIMATAWLGLFVVFLIRVMSISRPTIEAQRQFVYLEGYSCLFTSSLISVFVYFMYKSMAYINIVDILIYTSIVIIYLVTGFKKVSLKDEEADEIIKERQKTYEESVKK